MFAGMAFSSKLFLDRPDEVGISKNRKILTGKEAKSRGFLKEKNPKNEGGEVRGSIDDVGKGVIYSLLNS